MLFLDIFSLPILILISKSILYIYALHYKLIEVILIKSYYLSMVVKLMNRKYLVLTYVILITVSAIYIPRKSSKIIAIKYMEINKIYNDESYQEVKSRIYDISSDDVKNTLFKSDNYPLDDRIMTFTY